MAMPFPGWCISSSNLFNQGEPALWELLGRLQPKYRLKYVWEKAKGSFVCAETEQPEDEAVASPLGHGGCGHRQPLIRKEGLKMFTVDKKAADDEDSKAKKASICLNHPYGIFSRVNACRYFKQDGAVRPPEKRIMTALDCYNVLKKIPADDMEAMGLSAEFARPEWMILTVLPVPPAAVRPSVASPGKASAQDDLTYKLAEIIKANGSVQKAEQEGSPHYIINNFVELLQVRIDVGVNIWLESQLTRSCQRLVPCLYLYGQ
jgi:DNA-directed RNA polymerase II subunit RPB1